MITQLLASVVLLGGPAVEPSAAIWRFPDRYGPELREALVAQRGTGLPGHLVTDEELGAFLAQARPDTAMLDCFVDRGVCADDRRAALMALGLTSRIDATASRTDAGAYQVVFTQVSAGDAPPQTFTGEGVDLGQATDVALKALQGQGTVEVAVTPGDARLLLDGKPWGTGAGTYPATPGRHTLRAEAPGRRAVEMPVTVARGRRTPVVVELPVAYGKLALTVKTPNATVLLDGQPYDPSQPRELAPGKHVLEVSAPGYTSHRLPLDIKAATQHDIKLGLVPEGTDWATEFARPHQSTLRHTYLLRGAVRMSTLMGGSVSYNRGSGAERVALDDIEQGMSMTGVDVGVTWRSRYLICDALTLSVVGGGESPAKFEDGKGTVEGGMRVALRPAWFGLRYPMWRLEPYVVAGPILAFDSFDAKAPSGVTERFDDTSFLLGMQLGTRMHLTPEWFVHTAVDTSFWFNERPSLAFLVGAGWALDFDLPEWL